MHVLAISGEVRTANVKLESGRSRGMGTVSFYSAEDARRAIGILVLIEKFTMLLA